MLLHMPSGKKIGADLISWSKFLRLKGKAPDKERNKMMPTLHISQVWVWPMPSRISGAMYSFEPTNDFSILVLVIVSFERPKSIIFGFPSSDTIKFSGFKSLCTTLTL